MPFLALVNTEPKPNMPASTNQWGGRLWYDFWYWSMLASYTYGLSLRTEGHDNVPKRGSVLLLANHTSFLDPVAIGLAARRQLTFLARKTLFTGNKLFGKFLESVNCVPVDQDGIATEGLKTTIRELLAGKAVLVFPEGVRTPNGQMQPLKPGIHLILRRAPVTIVPVGIAGAFESYPLHEAYPKLAPLFLPATNNGVAVSIGKPLDGAKYAAMPREEAMKELFDKIHEMEVKAERLRRKPR